MQSRREKALENGVLIGMRANRRTQGKMTRIEHYAARKNDKTSRKGIERSSHQLSARLLKLQDEERRKFARELHDGAGQLVTSLIMNTDRLSRGTELSSELRELVAENAVMLQSLSKELGTVSHLLHPPLLDEVGLSSALQCYVEGFGQRSGIDTTLELDSNFGRLDSDTEIAIFRIVQECLTNVHRHSGSRTAAVSLNRSGREVRLEVQDEGKGISAEKVTSISGGGRVGVGLRGMRERVRELGGKFEVRSEKGTTVIASLPMIKARSMAA